MTAHDQDITVAHQDLAAAKEAFQQAFEWIRIARDELAEAEDAYLHAATRLLDLTVTVPSAREPGAVSPGPARP